MYIYKDKKSLDDKFPFKIDRFTLRREDNSEDHFHYHDFCEITYIESGIGKYKVSGKEYGVGRGDLIIFNNVEPHGWTVFEDMNVLVLVFGTELVADSTDLNAGAYLRPFLERGSNFKNMISANDDKVCLIKQIMEDIFCENEARQEGYTNIIRADVIRILTYLVRHYQGEEDGLNDYICEKKQAIHCLENAFVFINENYTENITLEQVAASVYMSPNYFSHYFKRLTGYSFMEYVTLKRLKRARGLFLTTNRNSSDIAFDCGFRNMSNFYRLYKKHLGPLPKR